MCTPSRRRPPLSRSTAFPATRQTRFLERVRGSPYLEGTSVWGDQGQLGEVGEIARRLPCHQAISSDSGVGADEKIRQRRSPCAAPPSISQERLAREKGGFVWNCFPVEHGF